jgi:hypothetical protein
MWLKVNVLMSGHFKQRLGIRYISAEVHSIADTETEERLSAAYDLLHFAETGDNFLKK